MVTFLREKFPNVNWRWNKAVEGGCSKRRPDLLLDMGNHIVIVEVDKNKDKDGNNVPSPWNGKRANGAATVSKKWKTAWEARLEKLRETVEMYIDSISMEDRL